MILFRLVMVLLVASPPSVMPPAGFQIIVNPANPVTELHRAEVRDLFLKRRTNWTETLKATPVDLSPRIDVRGVFSREILQLSTTAVTTYWMQEIFAGRTEPPQVMSTVTAAVAFVAATLGAIAYVPAETPLDGVRAVRVIP